MAGSQRLPRDSTPSENLADLSVVFYERIKPAHSSAMVSKKANGSVDGEEMTKLKYYQLRSRTKSASKAVHLDVSVGDIGNTDRVNGSRISYHLRSNCEALQVVSKDNGFEVLNKLTKSPVLPAHEPVKLDTSDNILGKKIQKINDQLELMETAHSPTPEDPMLSTETSTRKRISFRTRASSGRSLTFTCGNEDKLDASWNKTQNGSLDVEESAKNGKRCWKEEDGGEFESAGKNRGSNVANLQNLDKVQSALSHQEDVSRKKVKQALHEFHAIYNKLSQEAETDLKPTLEFRRRFDLMALKLVKKSNVELQFDSACIGNVPGVEVGDEFHLRVELCMLGLHRQLQAGIDFCKKDGRLLARSIISSGCSRYSDNGQISELLMYSGSGAPDKNQKMEYGNLALKNSIDAQNLIRVIRGFEEVQIGNSKNYKGRKAIRYIYDGLYLAEKFWMDKNDNGFDIFIFQLRRQKQQPELKIKQVRLRTSISFSDICIEDISNGKEKVPICAVNTIDEECPQPFTYTKETIYPLNYTPIPPTGCSCVGVCSDSIKCACAVKNGGELPFNSRRAIVQAKPLVFECGPSCKCAPSCHNRVSQHGIKFPLEVFKTKGMGWGLRSLSFISSGSFVCEYAGELIQDDDAQKRTNDEYLFAIGNNYHDEALWEGLPTSIPELQKRDSSEVDEINYTVDASTFGNVARFINHSCMPNLYAQNLLFDHGNKSMPHIMLFASEDIPPLEELTYHYNYTLGQVHDSNGNIKQKVCHCGTAECTGRLY